LALRDASTRNHRGFGVAVLFDFPSIGIELCVEATEKENASEQQSDGFVALVAFVWVVLFGSQCFVVEGRDGVSRAIARIYGGVASGGAIGDVWLGYFNAS
jgi:hypothetical protein